MRGCNDDGRGLVIPILETRSAGRPARRAVRRRDGRHLLAQLDAPNADKADGLWQLARLHAGCKQRDKAMDYLHQAMALQPDPESKAASILAMGQTAERVQRLRIGDQVLQGSPCAGTSGDENVVFDPQQSR